MMLTIHTAVLPPHPEEAAQAAVSKDGGGLILRDAAFGGS